MLTQSLLQKIETYYNPEKTSATRLNMHTACGYSLFTHCLFDDTNKKQT